MAIPGKLTINIGLQNEIAGSDSLYTAFNKTVDNFDNLFACSSSFTSFIGNTGINVAYGNSNTSVEITNTGVTSLTAGTGIVLSGNTGNITISSTGGGNGSGGTVTSVGITSTTLNIIGSPVVSSGNITVNMPSFIGLAGSYTNPTITVDSFGRITNASNNTISGTVTSVGITPGTGIQVVNSPITTSGNITVTNTGVTRISAGSGISISGPNGNVTIAALPVSAVTLVGLTSNSLTITGSPITSSGTFTVDLPTNLTITGNVLGGNLRTTGLVSATGNITGGNVATSGALSVTGNATIGNLTVTGNLSAGDIVVSSIANGTSNIDIIGTNGNVTTSVNGNANILVVTGTGANISGTFSVSGNANVGNIGATTFVGNLSGTTSSVSGNANVGNLVTSGLITATGNVSGGNLVTPGILSATGNIVGGNLTTTGSATITGNVNAGNIVLTTGNIIYTPRYGAFYSNVDQTNPIANTAMAMTFNNTMTANGVSVVSNSQLTIAKPGVYNIQFSAQLAKTGGGTSTADIWLAKNGTPVDWTNTSIYVTSGNPKVAAWNFVEEVTVANTYYEIMWASADTLVLLDASAANTSPTRPGIPSVIVTVTPVGA